MYIIFYNIIVFLLLVIWEPSKYCEDIKEPWDKKYEYL